MENNNGRGIFYGVIGVATLIVAIIGATFAYFTATANSAEDAVTVSGGNVSLSYTEVKTGLQSNLIPVNADVVAFNKIIGTSTTDCTDKNGNKVCSVYQFSIGNPSGNPAQTIYASLKPATNSFAINSETSQSNLKFAIYSGTATDVKNSSQTVKGTVTKTPATASPGDLLFSATSITGTTSIDLTILNEVLKPNTTRTYTVVLWIDETGKEQNNDQGKSFSGGIFFTTVGGEQNNGITGVLSA